MKSLNKFLHYRKILLVFLFAIDSIYGAFILNQQFIYFFIAARGLHFMFSRARFEA